MTSYCILFHGLTDRQGGAEKVGHFFDCVMFVIAFVIRSHSSPVHTCNLQKTFENVFIR